MRQLAVILCLTALAVPVQMLPAAQTPPPCQQSAPKIDTDLPLLFCDDFESGTAEHWAPSDPKAWRVEDQNGDSVYSQYQPSKVKTPVRSPFNRSMIKDMTVGDFVLNVRLQSTTKDYPHRDLCLFLGYQGPAHMYYVHLGKRADDNANQIHVVDNAPRRKISTKTTPGTNWTNDWHHARLTRNVTSGEIAVYFDDMQTPVMTAKDKTFTWGQVGLGSFDDTGRFDDVFLFGQKAEPPKTSDNPPKTSDNVPPSGFVALFNGTDLTGWKGLVGNPKTRAQMTPEQLAAEQEKADESMRQHWRVEDGALVFDGKGKSLCTIKDYEDFELLVDWKIEPKGDSGIYLRGTPQVQIWDPALRKIGSGGLFNNKENPSQPSVIADRPIREWNTFRITMIGEKVTVLLNGVLVVDNVTMENYWERDKPIYASGQIELQNHGNTLYFKNIYLRDTEETADHSVPPALPKAAPASSR